MIIAVTGSSGTIGTCLVDRIPREHIVSCLDKQPCKWNKNRITNIVDLREEFNIDVDTDMAILLAANARVDKLVKYPKLAKDNFDILFNSLESCRKKDISKIIFASSREVYGNSDKIIHSEDESYVKKCESPYTATKIGGEALVHSYQRCYGMDFVIIRYSNVYGMYDDSDRVVPKFINLARQNKPLPIYGKIKLLDYTYINDAVDGTLKCIDKFDKIKNNVFNIATGKGISIIETANIIKKLMKSDSEIVIKDSNLGEINRYVANINKANVLLDYEPKYNINTGLKLTIEWYNELHNMDIRKDK